MRSCSERSARPSEPSRRTEALSARPSGFSVLGALAGPGQRAERTSRDGTGCKGASDGPDGAQAQGARDWEIILACVCVCGCVCVRARFVRTRLCLRGA